MMKISKQAKRIWKYVGYAILALVAITAITVIWNKWFSRTRIAFINYQATTLGEISKANNNPFVVIEELPLEKLDDIDNYDMVFMNAMGIRLTDEQRDKIQMAGWTGTNILTTMSVNPDNYIVSVDGITADTLNAYLRGSSRRNYRSMLNYIRQNVDGKIIFKGEVEKVVPAPDGMFAHPDIDHPDDEDLYFDKIKDYEAYLQKHGLMKADAPKVIVTGMMGNPNDLIRALEKSGNTVYHVNKSFSAFIDANPSFHFNAVVNLAHGRLGDKVVEWLSEQNIPLFSTLSINRLTSEWEDDKQGMSGGFLSQSIVTPEIDGSIRPYVLFAQRINSEGIHEQYTIPERLEKFVTTVKNYISLQKKQNKHKRVAIVYFKGPGEQSLTASGLAVVPSLYNLLVRMRKEGYNVSGLPENSEKLSELLQRKGCPISDFTMLDAHPDTVVKVQFGNIALLPQPLAGHGDNTFQIVHGTDKDPVKEFQNAYYWIQNTFKADAMIHFGTHGGLEFTPRKQVALSSADWPDKLVGTIPHFYIYTIGNVGEALIAKRRTYAGIQSHLTAPFLESNLRAPYKALSDAIKVYNKAPGNAASLAVKKLAVGMGIHRDLGLDSVLTKAWNETEIAKVEEFEEELANEKIVGQLYTLGIPYEKARIESSVYAMTTDPIAYGMLRLNKLLKRAKTDTEKHKALFTTLYINPAKALVAKLFKSNAPVTDAFICQTAHITQAQLNKAREIEASKHNSEDMMSMMMGGGERRKNFKHPTTNHQHPKMDSRKALQMAKMAGASPEALKKMAAAMGLGSNGSGKDKVSNMMAQMAAMRKTYTREETYLAEAIMEVEQALKNVAHYKQMLMEAPQAELSSMINALNGGYTRPSSGGDVIANPRTLPTGRNLYGVNAETTPTESAWDKGKALAESTIRMYQEHHHDSLPRKVSFTFWSSEFIETGGTTIAQVLWLLGVEPVRDVFGRVTDIRLIPIKELGRPRIDVVVQTSGQFRDLAASRLYLINRAVQMAAEADDGKVANLVKEGVKESERTLTESGVSPKDAREMSTYRIFGALNGGYGTGIQQMVQQGDSWKRENEIADTYINNMSAFYGSEQYWEKASKVAFKAALTRTDAVVQPRQSNSWGALSLDHVYEFMGGMNLAVRHVTGKDPDAYFADYRNRNNNRMQELREAIGIESRSTIFNPTYIREKMKGGANEAAEFAEVIQNTYGWNVMKPNVIDNQMWQQIYDIYVKDKMNLGVNQFMREKNPAAMEQMAHTLVQTIQKGLWKTSPDRLRELQKLENDLHVERSKVESGKMKEERGTVMKKETLSEMPDTTRTIVTTSAVLAIVILAGVLLVFIIRKRRKEEEEWKP
ncbi:cobaltochelatase subunit CobN [Segatella bryantii]|uniref:cobaltochelatase subunit CobN n=1 Tax=Segatella bryantii TaxID=77095 RepID=UPI001EDA48A6|nr:cobaltochelatase subunit CobN [Segatella bryantii]UKK75054.1 cobaltochelatase subunit CobN [Segatella bryantii]